MTSRRGRGSEIPQLLKLGANNVTDGSRDLFAELFVEAEKLHERVLVLLSVLGFVSAVITMIKGDVSIDKRKWAPQNRCIDGGTDNVAR